MPVKKREFLDNKRELAKDRLSESYNNGCLLDRMTGDPVKKAFERKVSANPSTGKLPITSDSKDIMQNPRKEENPFVQDESEKIAQKRQELKNISEYLRHKIEKKTHNKKKAQILESDLQPGEGLKIGSDGIEALKRQAMEAEAKHANKKALMEQERVRLLEKIEKLKDRDRLRNNLKETTNTILGGTQNPNSSTLKLKDSSARKNIRPNVHGVSVKDKKYEPVRLSSRQGRRDYSGRQITDLGQFDSS